MDGFINLLKPPGMTSHDAVGFVRRLLHQKQVGHAGTLDPGAAGVLPVAVGKATRLIEYLDKASKVYRAELSFGISTDSGDDTGTIVEQLEQFTLPSRGELMEALKGFQGEITQVPPAHSAIKINGRRACDLVRQGIEVEIPSRQVTIHGIRLMEMLENGVLMEVECSTGTYIRSLCTDIGHALGIPATMSFLLRTRVSEFNIEDAVTIEELTKSPEKYVMASDKCIGHIQSYHINPDRKKAFCNGLITHDRSFGSNYDIENSDCLRVYAQEIFLGIGHFDQERQAVVPDKVIFR